jgi:ribosomal protein S16
MGAANSKAESNGITIQKIWTIVLIVNVVGGAFVGYYFLKNIQPYAAAQHNIKIEVEKLKTWKENHACVTDEIKKEIKECPKKGEIEPEFRRLNENMEALRKSHDETNSKIDDIHRWIMRQARSRSE